MSSPSIYFEIEQEIKQTPTQYLPTLLSIIHAFREGVCLDKLSSSVQTATNETQTPFDDLFGMVKTTRTVSLEEMEQGLKCFYETALLSEQALAEDWLKPEEDEAWAHLQSVKL